MIFLGLKGYGDLTILISFLMSVKTPQTVIVRRGLYDLANKFIGNNHNLIVLEGLDEVLPIYGLRNFNIKKILQLITCYFELKKIIISINCPLVIDKYSLRNNIFFHYKKITYLPKNKTIYLAYKDFFKNSNYQLLTSNAGSGYIIFPLSSISSKSISSDDLLKFIIEKSIDIRNAVVCIHRSHFNYLTNFNRFNTVIYDTIEELTSLILRHAIVLSVDTFQLHYSVLLRKKIILIGNVNPYFMPPSLSIIDSENA